MPLKNRYKSIDEINGRIRLRDREIPTVALTSQKRSREIAEILKTWIKEGEFLLSTPQEMLPV